MYLYFQNTPSQVNLICFIEGQRKLNQSLRTDYNLKKTYLTSALYKFNEIDDFDNLVNKYLVDCINIYLDMEFEYI